MDIYQPSTYTHCEVIAAERREARNSELTRAYAEGRSDEHEQWVALANLLHAHIAMAEQNEGAVTLSLAQVLSLSVALKSALGG